MKKLATILCAFAISALSYAQKNELKAAEKAIKNGNYAQAKASVTAAEALLPNMDNKLKDKFYFLKAKAYYAGGQVSGEDVNTAVKAIENLNTLKNETGKSKYIEDANEIRSKIFSSLANSAQSAFNSKNYEVAADNYLKAYNLSKQDTIFLYGAATAYLNAQKFDKSLPLYKQLLDMGYEGAGVEYTAIVKATGNKEIFADKKLRDLAVKSGKYISPKANKLPSKKGDILRFMSLIYSYKGDSEKALELIADAKKYNPNDMQLVIAEAKAYLANDEKEKMIMLLKDAKQMAGNNAVNLYNLGYYAMEAGENEIALDYFNKAIENDPKFADAYLNIANVITSQEEAIVKEMNSLGTSAADNAKYDELRDKKTAVLMEAIPYLEKAFELKPDMATGKFLLSVYNASFQNKKAKEFKSELEKLQN